MMVLDKDMGTMDLSTQMTIVKQILPSTDFLDIAVVDLNGTAYYTDGSTAELGDRDYIHKALQGESVVSDVLISKVTNEPVIMVATPIYQGSSIVGALVGRRDGNALSNLMDDTGYGKEGYGYIINSKGVVIAHPDRDKVINQFSPLEAVKEDASLASTAEIFKKILSEDNGIGTYTFNGTDYYAGYSAIEGTDWKLIITAAKKEVLATVPVLIRNIAMNTVVILLVAIIVVFFIGNSIAKPIINTVRHSEKIAVLDLSGNMEEKYLNKQDEIGILSRALQSITDSMRYIISDISNSSEQLAAASEELSATSQESANASEEVSGTIEEIARGASEQAKYTEDGSEKANILGAAIEKDQDHLESLNLATKKVIGVLQNGLTEIDYL